MSIPQIFQEFPELAHLAWRNLHADQHASVIGAVVAIVEQADVPAGTHPVQEVHQRTRTFGKFKTIDHLVPGLWRVTAHQMTDVRLGHFIVGQIERCVTMLAQLIDELQRLCARANLHPDKYVRFLVVVEAVIEFGNVAPPPVARPPRRVR